MKRLIAFTLCVIMLVSALGIVSNAQTFIKDESYVLGNADRSKDSDQNPVNMKDSNLMKSYILGVSGAEEAIDIAAADLNADGVINSKDLFYLKQYLVGDNDFSELESGSQLYRFLIGGTDIREFSILLAEGTDSMSSAYTAATTLQKYIEVATGFKPAIVYGENVDGHAIVINAVERFSELGEYLENENYIYEVADGNLQLYGTYRGNIYAAYEIIEKYLGFRFYDGEYTFLYKQRYVDIPEGTRIEVKPELKMRHTGQNVGSLNTYYLPARQNQTRSDMATAQPEYGTFYGPQFCNAHSYGLYWRMATGTMPDESFGTLAQRYDQQYNSGYQQDELAWQPCASTNSSYNTLFKGMIDTIARIQSWSGYAWSYKFMEDGEPTDYLKSGQPTMSFSLCDNECYCTCSKCRVKSATEGYSGLYIDLANRAVRDLQNYYPGFRVHCILYNHAIPQNVRPDKNLIVYYCGQGCNNHYLGSDECGTCMGQLKKENNVITNESLKAWGEFCEETGAEMWYWYYGVQYHYTLTDLPNVMNIYYDYKFLVEKCHCKGINYEGGGRPYSFATLKAYLSTRMMWDPHMSLDDFIGHMKEYLYMYYGDGYEKVYEFVMMMDECGDQCGTCFISNFDAPGDMYSIDYMCENYEYMRSLLTEAIELADRPEYRTRLETMRCCFDFLGLSYVYYDMYRDGDIDQQKLYMQRYTAMCNYMQSNNLSAGSSYSLPDRTKFDVNPMLQVYGHVDNKGVYRSDGSRRAEINNFFETGEKPSAAN